MFFLLFNEHGRSLLDPVTRPAAPPDVRRCLRTVESGRGRSELFLRCDLSPNITPMHRRSLRGTHWCLSAPRTMVNDGTEPVSRPGTFCIGRISEHDHRGVSCRRGGGSRDISTDGSHANACSGVRILVQWCPVPQCKRMDHQPAHGGACWLNSKPPPSLCASPSHHMRNHTIRKGLRPQAHVNGRNGGDALTPLCRQCLQIDPTPKCSPLFAERLPS